MKKLLLTALLVLPLALLLSAPAHAQRFGCGGFAINIGPGIKYANGPLYNYGPFVPPGFAPSYAMPPMIPQGYPYIGGYSSLPFAVPGYGGGYGYGAPANTGLPQFYSFGR